MIVTCPSCGRIASVSQAVLGQPLKCPQCGTEFTIGTAPIVEVVAIDGGRTARSSPAVILGMLVCGVIWLAPPYWKERVGRVGDPVQLEIEWFCVAPYSTFGRYHGIAYGALLFQWLVVFIIVAVYCLARKVSIRRRDAIKGP